MQTTIRGRLTCFCRVCYVMWYGQEECDEWYVMYEIDHVLVIGFTTCMSMSMTTGRSHRSCLNLFMTCVSMKTPCNYFTLLLTVSHSSRSNSWRGNFMKTRWWRSWCQAGDKMIMEPRRWRSKGAEWYWPYHVTIWLHVMFIMFLHLVYLERR